jgi:hypothetical protein
VCIVNPDGPHFKISPDEMGKTFGGISQGGPRLGLEAGHLVHALLGGFGEVEALPKVVAVGKLFD